MSSMWKVTVSNRGTDWIDFTVRVAHPDAGLCPASKGFALDLMQQPAFVRQDGKYVPASPLGESLGTYVYADPRRSMSVSDRYVDRVHAVRSSEPFDEERMRRVVEDKVRASGIDEEDDGWNDAVDDAWHDFWEDVDALPRAVLRVTVTEPEWIRHLTPGLTFDSAAYCESGPWLGHAIDEDPGLPPDAEVRG